MQKKILPKIRQDFLLEQGTGVEPAFTAWEAVVLPIYEPCIQLSVLYQNQKEISSPFCQKIKIFFIFFMSMIRQKIHLGCREYRGSPL